MSNHYDAIIVGAGPAGSTAARHLARAGLKTLLLEKEKLPRYKPCGGGLTAKVREVLDVDFSATVEDTIVRLSVAHRASPRVMVDVGETLGWCVMRDKFDALLAEEAVRAGAELRENSAVTRVEVDHAGVRVHTARDEIRAAVLIGADGANSFVARAVGLPNKLRVTAALEAEMDLPAASVDAWRGVWHLDYGAIPGGYGWIFPKAGHLSVGVAPFLPNGRGQNLREILNRYIASEPTLRTPKHMMLRGHLLPLGGKFEPLHKTRVLLAGDAAHLIDPFTGEGIYAAIKSGVMAADAVKQAIASGDWSFANYSARIHSEFTRDYVYAWRLNQIFYRVPRFAVRALSHSKMLQQATLNVIERSSAYRQTLFTFAQHPFRLLIQPSAA